MTPPPPSPNGVSIAACTAIANATAVNCTTASDSQALACDPGFFVNGGICKGMGWRGGCVRGSERAHVGACLLFLAGACALEGEHTHRWPKNKPAKAASTPTRGCPPIRSLLALPGRDVRSVQLHRHRRQCLPR